MIKYNDFTEIYHNSGNNLINDRPEYYVSDKLFLEDSKRLYKRYSKFDY